MIKEDVLLRFSTLVDFARKHGEMKLAANVAHQTVDELHIQSGSQMENTYGRVFQALEYAFESKPARKRAGRIKAIDRYLGLVSVWKAIADESTAYGNLNTFLAVGVIWATRQKHNLFELGKHSRFEDLTFATNTLSNHLPEKYKFTLGVWAELFRHQWESDGTRVKN